jgi:formylglycine-generating enzyme required for sulfatase activity
MKKTVALFAVLAVLGCSNPSEGGDEGPPVVNVSGVNLDQTTLTIVVGRTETLTATITPANATNQNVNWKSDDTDIATVDDDGMVTAVAVGEATITVTTEDGEYMATCNVTVTDYGISLDPPETYTFPEDIEGYGAQTPKTVTVSNTGTEATGELTAALLGANAGSFTLNKTSINSIAVDGNDTFTVVPNMGLSAKTYTAMVTVSGGNSISAEFEVSFTVNHAPITETAQGVNYTLKVVPIGTVSIGNTGSGNTTRWGAGTNFAYTKPYSMSAFYMGETEITYELWKAVYDWATHTDRGANQYTFTNPGQQGGQYSSTGPVGTNQHPVTAINWRDAVVWCNAYSEAAGKTPVYYLAGTSDFSDSTKVLRESEGSTVSNGSGKAEKAVQDPNAGGFRLPTEAQWEYAARGGVPGTGTPWTYTYAGSNTIDDVAVYEDNSGGKTAEVKSKTANTLGLYDMSGNVGEWCQDVYSGTDRVFRGGSWYNDASYCSVTDRRHSYPNGGHSSVGFRLVAACP